MKLISVFILFFPFLLFFGLIHIEAKLEPLLIHLCSQLQGTSSAFSVADNSNTSSVYERMPCSAQPCSGNVTLDLHLSYGNSHFYCNTRSAAAIDRNSVNRSACLSQTTLANGVDVDPQQGSANIFSNMLMYLVISLKRNVAFFRDALRIKQFRFILTSFCKKIRISMSSLHGGSCIADEEHLTSFLAKDADCTFRLVHWKSVMLVTNVLRQLSSVLSAVFHYSLNTHLLVMRPESLWIVNLLGQNDSFVRRSMFFPILYNFPILIEQSSPNVQLNFINMTYPAAIHWTPQVKCRVPHRLLEEFIQDGNISTSVAPSTSSAGAYLDSTHTTVFSSGYPSGKFSTSSLIPNITGENLAALGSDWQQVPVVTSHGPTSVTLSEEQVIKSSNEGQVLRSTSFTSTPITIFQKNFLGSTFYKTELPRTIQKQELEHTAQKPQLANTAEKLEPAHIAQKPQPAHIAQKPQPAQTAQKPQPAHTAQKPQPAHTAQKPQPVRASYKTEPVPTTQEKILRTTTSMSIPVTVSQENILAATSQKPEPELESMGNVQESVLSTVSKGLSALVVSDNSTLSDVFSEGTVATRSPNSRSAEHAPRSTLMNNAQENPIRTTSTCAPNKLLSASTIQTAELIKTFSTLASFSTSDVTVMSSTLKGFTSLNTAEESIEISLPEVQTPTTIFEESSQDLPTATLGSQPMKTSHGSKQNVTKDTSLFDAVKSFNSNVESSRFGFADAMVIGTAQNRNSSETRLNGLEKSQKASGVTTKSHMKENAVSTALVNLKRRESFNQMNFIWTYAQICFIWTYEQIGLVLLKVSFLSSVFGVLLRQSFDWIVPTRWQGSFLGLAARPLSHVNFSFFLLSTISLTVALCLMSFVRCIVRGLFYPFRLKSFRLQIETVEKKMIHLESYLNKEIKRSLNFQEHLLKLAERNDETPCERNLVAWGPETEARLFWNIEQGLHPILQSVERLERQGIDLKESLKELERSFNFLASVVTRITGAIVQSEANSNDLSASELDGCLDTQYANGSDDCQFSIGSESHAHDEQLVSFVLPSDSTQPIKSVPQRLNGETHVEHTILDDVMENESNDANVRQPPKVEKSQSPKENLQETADMTQLAASRNAGKSNDFSEATHGSEKNMASTSAYPDYITGVLRKNPEDMRKLFPDQETQHNYYEPPEGMVNASMSVKESSQINPHKSFLASDMELSPQRSAGLYYPFLKKEQELKLSNTSAKGLNEKNLFFPQDYDDSQYGYPNGPVDSDTMPVDAVRIESTLPCNISSHLTFHPSAQVHTGYQESHMRPSSTNPSFSPYSNVSKPESCTNLQAHRTMNSLSSQAPSQVRSGSLGSHLDQVTPCPVDSSLALTYQTGESLVSNAALNPHPFKESDETIQEQPKTLGWVALGPRKYHPQAKRRPAPQPLKGISDPYAS